MVTIFALIDYDYTCDSTPCQVKDASSRPLHIVMITLGAFAVFLVWFMLIFINCKINTGNGVGNQAMTGYNQSYNLNSFGIVLKKSIIAFTLLLMPLDCLL
jgi:hypothetical protein